MKKIALIPARYQSTRLPHKMLRLLGGKPLIVRTYEAVCKTGLFDQVIVVCDHDLIRDAVLKYGGKVLKSRREHPCGTDRIAEAVALMKETPDLIVNVQGDEPFTKRETLQPLLEAFEGKEGANIRVASLMFLMNSTQDINDPNQVKVVINQNQEALLFSRSPIPYYRNKEVDAAYYKHIGIYALRPEILKWFARQPQTPLEKAEQLEHLRFLENGIPIKMIKTPFQPIGIDTEEDLIKAEALMDELYGV